MSIDIDITGIYTHVYYTYSYIISIFFNHKLKTLSLIIALQGIL